MDMRTKDYEMILDSLQMTGVYVIREDTHEILYYNKRVKIVAPNIEKGMVCHELWKGSCANCPLLHIGNKEEACSVNYDDPFGKAVEIRATRMVWNDTIPAFMIVVTPHNEVANYIHNKILRANLSSNTFEIVKVDGNELHEMQGRMDSLSDWFDGVASGGYIYVEDLERYQKFTRMETLQKEFQNGAKIRNCIYRRKTEGTFKWHILEIVPDMDYTNDNQTVMIYVKDVDNMFRDGLEREETNVRNQEIINILGRMNFAIYVVNLEQGYVNVVSATKKVHEGIADDRFFWDDLFSGMGSRYVDAESWKEFSDTFSREAMKRAWENGERKVTFVCRALLDDVWKYISVSAFLRESRRQGVYAIMTFQDVDEHMRSEMERKRNDQRMAAIIRSRYSILNTVDLETGMCERVYLEEDNVMGRAEADYETYIQMALEHTVMEEDRKKFADTFLLANLRKKAEDVVDFKEEVCQYRHKTKPVFWAEEHVMYIRQGDKIIVNILGRDITAEKQAEERARRDIREKVSIIQSLSSMFFATYYVDLENNTFRAVVQKKEVGNILGDEQNYMQGIGTYADNFVADEDREGYMEHLNLEKLRSTLNEEHIFTSYEYRKKSEEGVGRSWIRASVILAEATSDGTPKYALYVAQDITESKLRQEREQQALKDACDAANHANAAKSEFMSRMSHDIRTPMNAIIGMTAIAGKYLDDKERVADCLGKITVSSKHLLSLINEVLDMSKIESGKIDLSEEEVNLSDLIGNLVTMIRPTVLEREHTLNVRINNVEHENVVGDPVRLQQIFMNILGNSVKYTPNGGTLTLEINEKPSHMCGYGHYEFIFSDNGIGMSKEFMEKLFEPFSREEDSRVSKIEGTGLGMTIARNLARRMNGDITVESKLGEGTKFVVDLSFQLLNVAEPDVEEFAALSVLVADDDEAACEATCLVLENIGMESEYVLNGKDAVERVWERHQQCADYFAVILDWKMPDMDGVATARAIRDKVGPDIPIIILSAYDWSDIEEEARLGGVNGFISKPLFKSRLIYLFHQLVGSKEEANVLTKPLSEAQLAGKRVLLAEDNAINREIAEEVLSQTGVAVESVENGKQALEQFEKMPLGYYDMIFMDIQMPVMNGYDATAAIRSLAREDALHIPIIAMTANAFAEDIRRSKQAGMNEHLTKPLDMEHLMECLGRWLGE